MNSEHFRFCGKIWKQNVNDIFLVKPSPTVTEVIPKFFDAFDRIDFDSTTFCCDECRDSQYRWKLREIKTYSSQKFLLKRAQKGQLTHYYNTDRHIVYFSIFLWSFNVVSISLFSRYLSNRDNLSFLNFKLVQKIYESV